MKARIKRKGREVNAKATTKKSESSAGATQAAATAVVKPQILKVKGGAKFRGAREQWYSVLQAHDGKPVGEFLEATKAKPPSLTKKGEAENPQGWLRFFIRSGVVSMQAAG